VLGAVGENIARLRVRLRVRFERPAVALDLAAYPSPRRAAAIPHAHGRLLIVVGRLFVGGHRAQLVDRAVPSVLGSAGRQAVGRMFEGVSSPFSGPVAAHVVVLLCSLSWKAQPVGHAWVIATTSRQAAGRAS
jgi:hypothetical protein